jgi:ribosomal protein L40E
MKKVIEDFICLNCGATNVGDGYTNHCAECLYSLHVDRVEPGDRQSRCKGLMLPVNWSLESGRYRVLNQCKKCGHEKWNSLKKEDSIEALSKIVVYP